MTQHYKELDNHKKWIKIWVDPLLSMMKNKPNSAFEQVLGKVVKLHSPVIHYVLMLVHFKLLCGVYIFSRILVVHMCNTLHI
jgi:hypothetical protein